jgi:hypothetical protein
VCRRRAELFVRTSSCFLNALPRFLTPLPSPTHTHTHTVSIVGWVLIAFLVLAEVNNYLTPQFNEHMVVDTSLGQQLRINVNVTFHALTCNEVHLDAMDVAGDNQLNVEHEMVKQRVSSSGQPIGHAGVEIIGEV